MYTIVVYCNDAPVRRYVEDSMADAELVKAAIEQLGDEYIVVIIDNTLRAVA